jgi:hypothetical protein
MQAHFVPQSRNRGKRQGNFFGAHPPSNRTVAALARGVEFEGTLGGEYVRDKIIHATARQVHAPTAKPYVKKEKNNFGITDTVYTRFCNFHTGSSRTSTLLRGPTSGKSIKMFLFPVVYYRT